MVLGDDMAPASPVCRARWGFSGWRRSGLPRLRRHFGQASPAGACGAPL